MAKLAADEDFDNTIVNGLLRVRPTLDIVRIQDTPMYHAKDPRVLDWLAQEGRILLTHDRNTMTKHAGERLDLELRMPGMIVVKQQSPVGQLVFGYYLRHQQEIDEYLVERQRKAKEIKSEIESRPEYIRMRDKFLARKKAWIEMKRNEEEGTGIVPN